MTNPHEPSGKYKKNSKGGKKYVLASVLPLIALAMWTNLAYAAFWTGPLLPWSVTTNEIRIGASGETPDGTLITGVYHGTVSFASGATTNSLTLAGISSSARISTSVKSGNSSNRYVLTAAPSTNSVLVTLSGAPGATTVIDVIAIEP